MSSSWPAISRRAVGEQPLAVREDQRPAALRVVADPTRSRALEMVALRKSGMRLAEIGRRYGLSRQRVAQIIDQAGRVPVSEVRAARRQSQTGSARERCHEVLERYRAGLKVGQIARETGLGYEAIRSAISQFASDGDRAARKHAGAVSVLPPRYSDRELLSGLRLVAGQLGHSPSMSEYTQLASQLGLATMATVYQRFGGWRHALGRAELDPGCAPVRVHAPRWDLAACWTALLSVADQLGDPPRYQRYARLARERDDLPSAATVRVRLGLWPEIASALAERNGSGRNGARPAAERNGAVTVAVGERRSTEVACA